MKRVRFIVDDRVLEGAVGSEGRLVAADGRDFDPREVRWLPPVQPGKVIGLALNYADHAAELNVDQPEDPPLFLKPPNALVGHLAPVIYPHGAQYLHYEVELAVVIGRRARKVKAAHAADHIEGYTIANDVTVRDFVGNFYRPPIRAKGQDTFGPMGPYLVTADEIDDPANLELRAFVNGELRQRGNSSQMTRSPAELIELISSFMTLERGDCIWTGTPRGISHVHPGDVMRLEIDGLGALENPVIAEPVEAERPTATAPAGAEDRP